VIEKPFKIGALDFKHRTVLSPMASLTDLAFRILMDEIGGIGYMVTEMVSVEGINRKNRKTLDMLKTVDFKIPQFIQLFGADPGMFIKAVKFIQDTTSYSGIDINMGCPVKKIISRGAGAALLGNLPLAAKILHEVRQYSRLPITVKIRLRPEESEMRELIRIIEGEGVDAIIVHFRQVGDRYSQPADWDLAPLIQGIMTTTFIGNGDIKTVPEAREKLKQVDAIMIGREALRNPGLFAEIARQEDRDPEGDLDGTEFRVVIGRLLELIEEIYPPELRLNRIKSYTRYLVAGRKEARNLRREVYASHGYEEARNHLARFYMFK
jgi:nifR3 family TIM-barrel protein